MKTRTFCPGCGGYRDIEDGHRVCTFCEYIDEQRDGAKALSRQTLQHRFSIDGVGFIISFGIEQGHLAVSIATDEPRYELLADGLTAAWKLRPVELLESLCDHRAVPVGGEFYTITYDDDPERKEDQAPDVIVFGGDAEVRVPSALFSAVVVEVARFHLRAPDAAYFPWLTRLSSAARARIS